MSLNYVLRSMLVYQFVTVPSVHLSVSLFLIRRHCVKTLNILMKFFHPPGSATMLCFRELNDVTKFRLSRP